MGASRSSWRRSDCWRPPPTTSSNAESVLATPGQSTSRPILFVCGPPRSGTTLVGLSLMRSLDVAYLTNATSVFPLSPITASDLLRAIPDGRHVPLESYYGRTAGFRAPNDGLHLWDRWLGTDRGLVRDHIEADGAQAMVEFFGAYEAWTGRPLVAKNNALDAHAALVAAHLPTARFLCLTRDPLFLGQSLLLARRAIHGSDRQRVWTPRPGRDAAPRPVPRHRAAGRLSPRARPLPGGGAGAGPLRGGRLRRLLCRSPPARRAHRARDGGGRRRREAAGADRAIAAGAYLPGRVRSARGRHRREGYGVSMVAPTDPTSPESRAESGGRPRPRSAPLA